MKKLVIALAMALAVTAGAEKKPPEPTAWLLVTADSAVVRPKFGRGSKDALTLGRGALVPALEVKQSRTRVRAIDPAKLEPTVGWVDSDRGSSLPLGQYPKDSEIFKKLGGSYLDDFTAANTAVARFVLARSAGEPVLVCYLGSPVTPTSRLQLLVHNQGKWTLGPQVEYSFSELKSPITSIEVRDLAGDGNDCLITHEPFTMGPANEGVLIIIRRLVGDELKVLWKGPLDWSNLASYPAKSEVRQPTESNIGTAGTVTKSDLEFRARGRQTDLLWKGKIEFHALGREEPVDTINVEKTLSWDGTKFVLRP